MTARAFAVIAAMVCARPAHASFTLSVSTLGPAGAAQVTSSIAGIACGNGSSSCSAAFAAGSTVTLTEVPGSTTAFAGWGGANGCPNNLTQCAVVMDGARSVTAKFNPVLSVSLHGNGAGSVTSSTGSINCSYSNGCAGGAAVTQSFAPGTVVVLHSSAAANSTFTGWTGGGCSAASTCTVTMSSYKTVAATFTSAGPFTISVSKGGSGLGTVTSSPVGIACGGVCRSTFSAGAFVTLTASTGTGSHFAGWANGGCSGTSTCVVVSSSVQQGLGGSQSPAAFFYR